MDYVKRDVIRDEIDILINRIVVLQAQEKEYADLTKEISSLKKKEKENNEKLGELDRKIKESEEYYWKVN